MSHARITGAYLLRVKIAHARGLRDDHEGGRELGLSLPLHSEIDPRKRNKGLLRHELAWAHETAVKLW